MMLSVLLNSVGFVTHVDSAFEHVSWSRLFSRDSVVPSIVRCLLNWFTLSIGSWRSLFGQAYFQAYKAVVVDRALALLLMFLITLCSV